MPAKWEAVNRSQHVVQSQIGPLWNTTDLLFYQTLFAVQETEQLQEVPRNQHRSVV